jgi:hypothetical protein
MKKLFLLDAVTVTRTERAERTFTIARTNWAIALARTERAITITFAITVSISILIGIGIGIWITIAVSITVRQSNNRCIIGNAVAITGAKRTFTIARTKWAIALARTERTFAITVSITILIGIWITIAVSITVRQGYDRRANAVTVARAKRAFAVRAARAFRAIGAFPISDLIAVTLSVVILAMLVLVLVAASHGDCRECQQQGHGNN